MSTLFHNPHCSKSRETLRLLRTRGMEPDIRLYLAMPPSVDELRELLQMLGTGPRGLLRTGEPEYSALGLDAPDIDDDALLSAMHSHPALIERPIYVHNGRAVIGRPPERVLELLD